MNKQTTKINSLPLKKLNWEKLIPFIGDAREAVARLDEATKNLSQNQLETLLLKDSTANARGAHKGKALLTKQALDAAIRMKNPFTLSAWCRIHAIAKADGPNPKEIGKIRTRQNWIGPEGSPKEMAYFFPPAPTAIPKYLHALETYLAIQELDPLVQIAIAFAQFLAIHPFMDGNGRVARILIPVFAVKKKLLKKPVLLLSRYIEKTREEYMTRLFDITEKNEWEEWILYFLKGIIRES